MLKGRVTVKGNKVRNLGQKSRERLGKDTKAGLMRDQRSFWVK